MATQEFDELSYGAPSFSIRVMLTWGTIKRKADFKIKFAAATTITKVRCITGQFASTIAGNLQGNLQFKFYHHHLSLMPRSTNHLDPKLSSALNSV